MHLSSPRGDRGIIRFSAGKRTANLLLGIAACLLRLANAGVALFSGPTEGDKRVLVVEPFGLGDVITLEPLVRTLRASGFCVALCARDEWKALYEGQVSWISAQIPWARLSAKAKYRLADYFSPGFRRLLRGLRAAGKGGIGLDTRGDIRSVLLLHAAGCRQVLTLDNYLGSDLRILPVAATQVAFETGLRRWELNLKFAEGLAEAGRIKPGSPTFEHLGAGTSRSSHRRIGLIAVAPWKGKWWRHACWQELRAVLLKAGHEPIGLCGPGQVTLAGEQLGEIQILECHSIEAWVAELRRCDAVVSLDSGPMHLADGLGVPVVALFGQGLLPLWAPSRSTSVVVHHQQDGHFIPCQPTDENTGVGRALMDRITVDEVVAALRRTGLAIALPGVEGIAPLSAYRSKGQAGREAAD
jgi:ADP-heptose:LPS heptosyltransferase